MKLFWKRGYSATSMEDLVRATKVNRGGIYSDFGGKRELFCACMALYQDEVVTPAFARVEALGADLDAVESFFEHHISRIAASGRASPGCLVANTMTEIGPRDPKIRSLVKAHNDRIEKGFLHALRNETLGRGEPDDAELRRLAAFMLVSAHGLFSYSRSTNDTTALRAHAQTIIALVRSACNPAGRHAIAECSAGRRLS